MFNLKRFNMKVLVRILAFALAIFILQPNCAEAQNKQLDKAHKKEYKAKMSEYNKEGWKIYGTSHSLDVALLEHYEKLKKEGVVEISSTTKSTSKSIGQEKLLTYACNDYAHRSETLVRGRITNDLASVVSTDELAEFEHFYAAYETAVQKLIQGELNLSYTVYRSLGKQDGNEVFEFQAIYVVDENSASQARIRAFKNAAAESAAAQKYAEKISDFVQEAFTW